GGRRRDLRDAARPDLLPGALRRRAAPPRRTVPQPFCCNPLVDVGPLLLPRTASGFQGVRAGSGVHRCCLSLVQSRARQAADNRRGPEGAIGGSGTDTGYRYLLAPLLG